MKRFLGDFFELENEEAMKKTGTDCKTDTRYLYARSG